MPALFTRHPHHENGWRDKTGGLCCVSSSLGRRSKAYLTPLYILPGLHGMLFFYFLWCQRERHEIWLCGPSPWMAPEAGESWKLDLVPTEPSARATEQIQTELGAQGPSSRLPLLLLPNTQPRAFSRMQSLAPSCALSFEQIHLGNTMQWNIFNM